MKTDLTLRSTLSNTSWTQRGATALLLAGALIIALTLALRSNTHAPAAAPAAHQAASAARNRNLPINSTDLAYDGKAQRGAPAGATRLAHRSSILTAASSAYDGRTYVVGQLSRGNSPILTAASSAYDGRTYRSAPAAARFVRDIPALRSTGSAYGGQ